MTQFTCKGVKQINNRISLNMTFTFTICISLCFSSAREFQMGNFQKYWSQNVGQDFFVLDFFHWRKILKVDGRDPQNQEKNSPAGRFTCMNDVPWYRTCIFFLFVFFFLEIWKSFFFYTCYRLKKDPKMLLWKYCLNILLSRYL
jgi:hypothetical protein